MSLFSPQEIAENYALAGANKTKLPIYKMLLLGILAGALIAFAAAASSTAAHAVENVGLSRMISGLIFPFGLAMVVLSSAELFTGNCLISISVLSHRAAIAGMLKNWLFVYVGNLIGSLFVAAGCAFSGQFNYSSGVLAVYTIRCAAAKCSLPFGNAVILGILCNVLVTLGVLLSLGAKDLTGRMFGAYMPVAFFVICGFEHSVANMYYIPAGLFAAQNASYAALATESGIDLSMLTWGNFFVRNLLPVTIGNLIGGICIGLLVWICFIRKKGA